MRAMGRRLRLESPTILDVNLCPARIPLSILMVEPEFPASRKTGYSEGSYPNSPRPLMMILDSRSSTLIPSLRMQFKVEWQSALEAKPEIVDVPFAIDASIATRCEMDLSPGTVDVPFIRADPLILIDLDIATCRMLHNDAP